MVETLGKVLIMGSYLGVDSKRVKEPLLTDQSVGGSKPKDLPVGKCFT